MKIGKLAANDLKEVILNKIDNFRSDVVLPAGPGEDCAVISFGNELLVVSSDPITGAEKNAGFIAVNVACNDIAAAGAEPFGLQVVLLLPPSLKESESEKIMEDIVASAKNLDVEILGGHTEITDLVEKPIVTITALGRAEKEELAASSSAKNGDILYITKGMGIEGAYILANDYKDTLLASGVSEKIISELSNYLNLLSVLPESRIARKHDISAMHDITEGGVYGAVAEMAAASKLGYIIEKDNFDIKPEIKVLCDKLDLDPAALISSGSMLIAAQPELDLNKIFSKKGIKLIRVGKLVEKGSFIEENGVKEEFSPPNRDELWKFIEKESK